jgi:hypothetical protein
MPKSIRLNDPDDGAWIMARVGGAFDESFDRCIANTRDGEILGGFVFQNFTGRGGSIMVHMAGEDPRWCSRDLLWMAFDYPFNQLHVDKLIAPVPGHGLSALVQNMRAGFMMETQIDGVFPGGAPLVVLSMTRDQCRWLRARQKNYVRNYEMADG